MNPEQWWKTFALGIEIDVAGTFIYNGIRALHEAPSLYHSTDNFEVLYNLSVGIERLLKVAIILLEHHDESDIDQLEESLYSHSTIDLANRVNAQSSLKLSSVHREFLSLLSKFYKTHRYGRYSPISVPMIEEEKRLFLKFISKHLQIEISDDNGFGFIPNTNQIRRFVGRILKTICRAIFAVVCRRADELNIYTPEIRGDAKAIKVFYGDRLDFIDEDLTKRELLLFLMSVKSRGAHTELLQSYEALELDPALVPSYIRALLNDTQLYYVGAEVVQQYADVDDIIERHQFLEIMDNEYLSFDEEDEA